LDKRTLLALVLCFLVLIGFQLYQAEFAPPPRPQQAAEQTVSPEAEPIAPSGTASLEAAGPPSPGAPTATAAEQPVAAPPPVNGAGLAPAAFEAPVKDYALENDFLLARLTSAGAEIRGLRLKRYFAPDEKSPLELLEPYPGPEPAPALELGVRDAPVALEREPWASAQNGLSLSFERPATSAVEVKKTITLAPDGYHFDVALAFRNTSGAPAQISYVLYGADGITLDDLHGRSMVSGIAGLDAGGRIKFEALDSEGVPPPGAPEEKRKEWTNAVFGGTASKYFAAVLIPLTPDLHSVFFMEQTQGIIDPAHGTKHTNVRTGFRVRDLKLAAGETAVHRYLFYAGPKDRTVLARYQTIGGKEVDLPLIVDLSSRVPLGETLSNVFLAILHAFRRIVGNYGLAVILLTVLVRVLLHPLNRMSQRSTYKMQKLAPAVKKIQDKYKGKKTKESAQKMNMEIMELYNAHGANPMLGCLPMLLQFPVFIGLYNAVAYAIELRQQHFLWIRDLSLPDRLLSFGTTLPWPLEGYLNLLPVLMVVTMVIQQKLQPAPPDPQQRQQQQMMGWMVPLFGVLFYTVPSGLVLYFLTSALLGIAEQRWVRAQIEREDAAKPLPAA
jgi:YidC/Oxa1 family membrane protein insertase